MSSSDDTPPPPKPTDDAPSDQEPVPSDSSVPSEESPKVASNEEGNSVESTSTDPPTAASPSSGDWQAIWAPTHNAYYFYNTMTQETTWTNPLQQADNSGASSSTSASPPPATYQPVSSSYDIQAAALAQGIDPSLAYLDPSLAAGPSNPAAFTYTAKFNARTGAFARPDARDPSHLSEHERAKRMSEFYFDVGAWEKEVDQRQQQEEEAGKKRKKPTKKDLDRFREQKKQKKIAKTAWLRT